MMWPVITVVVVLINAGILLFFGIKWSRDEPAAVTATSPITQPAAQVAATANLVPAHNSALNPAPNSAPSSATPLQSASPKAQQPKPQVNSQVAVQAKQPQATLIEPSSPEQPVQQDEPPLPSVGYLPQLEELPSYERDGIPNMTFSSHMYSSMPKFRSIIINGKRLKEGQFLNEELQVREITESGVIMSRGNTLFEVDVLGRWAQ